MLRNGFIERNCSKCGKKIVARKDDMTISAELCDSCWKKWCAFFDDNHERIEKLYTWIEGQKNPVNPTWEMFIGNLKDKKPFVFR